MNINIIIKAVQIIFPFDSINYMLIEEKTTIKHIVEDISFKDIFEKIKIVLSIVDPLPIPRYNNGKNSIVKIKINNIE